MAEPIKRLLKPVASLRLAVVLMAAAIVLIFCATWAQIDKGIWAIINEYFRSIWVWIPIHIFLPRPETGQPQTTFGFPWPGGYLIGPALLINLLAAHAIRFKLQWKRSGIFLIHGSIILLLVGEAVTREFAIEAQMPIYEGQATQWTQDIREVELAIIDHGDAAFDDVVTISQSMLQTSTGVIGDPMLPFDVKVDRFMINTRIDSVSQDAANVIGFGNFLRAVEVRQVSGIDDQSVNYPAVIISVATKDGKKLGSYVLSPHFTAAGISFELRNRPEVVQTLIMPYAADNQVDVIGQRVSMADKSYSICLRFRRYYKDYVIRLEDFTHDYYTGTTIHKNFASRINLTDPQRGEDRDVLIYMNHPLRYAGETFFQSGWLGNDLGTILQVVKNPGWQIPYIACTVGAIGMLLHFGTTLTRFLRRNAT